MQVHRIKIKQKSTDQGQPLSLFEGSIAVKTTNACVEMHLNLDHTIQLFIIKRQNLDILKFKAFADDKINVAQ